MPAAESADVVRGISAAAQAEMLADLSPPARVLVTALDVGAGLAVGLGKPLTAVAESAVAEVVSVLGDDVVGVVAEIASDVTALIPVVGPIIKGVVMIVQALVNAFKGPDDGAECQSLFSVYAPKGTGAADMAIVPADIFARVHSVGLWYAEGRGANTDDAAAAARLAHALIYEGAPIAMGPTEVPVATLSGSAGLRPMVPFGPSRCRSALGMALMQITEGSVVDVRDLEHVFAESSAHPSKHGLGTRLDALRALAENDKERALITTPAAVRALWGKALARDNRLAPLQWAHAHPDDRTRGLPPAWVNRFRRLRRAIEKSGYGSDGGVALWLMYQDLLVSAFDRGYLTPEYVEFLFARQAPAANRHWLTSPHWFSADPLFRRIPDKEIVESDNLIAAPPTWIWHEDPCPHMVTKVVLNLVDRWRSTIHPKYAQGQEKLRRLGVAPEELRAHASAVGRQRALATTSAARAVLDRRRAAAEDATDEQRLAALRAAIRAAPTPSARPEVPAPATAQQTHAATAEEDGAARVIVVGAGVLGGLLLLRRLLRRPPSPAIG